MLVIAKSKAYFSEARIKWREKKPGAKEILEEYLALRKKFGSNNDAIERGICDFYEKLPKGHPSKRHSRYNKVDARGIWRDDNMSWPGSGGPIYDVVHPTTGKSCSVPEGGWRYATLEKMEQMILRGKVIFRDDHTEPPIRKTYLIDIDDNEQAGEESGDIETDDDADEDLPIQVAGSYFYRSALQASNELNKIFGEKVFNNPKDREVISRWMSYVGAADNDIVMDFFAGSGTTAHAVLQLNLSEQKSLRYILVQLPEPINSGLKGTKSAVNFLKKLGKPYTISELTKERLRRVGSNLKSTHPDWEGDTGFRVFKLDVSNIRAWNPDQANLEKTLLEHEEHILPGRTEADVMYELLLKLGLDLCVPIEAQKIAEKTVNAIGGGVLIACLAEKIDSDVVEQLTQGIVSWSQELAPEGDITCVFRDSAFVDDVAKSNLAAILEQQGITNVRSL